MVHPLQGKRQLQGMQYSGQECKTGPKMGRLPVHETGATRARFGLGTVNPIYLVGAVGAGLWAGAGWVLTGWDLRP